MPTSSTSGTCWYARAWIAPMKPAPAMPTRIFLPIGILLHLLHQQFDLLFSCVNMSLERRAQTCLSRHIRNAEVQIRAATVRERFSQLGAALPDSRGSDKFYGSELQTHQAKGNLYANRVGSVNYLLFFARNVFRDTCPEIPFSTSCYARRGQNSVRRRRFGRSSKGI